MKNIITLLLSVFAVILIGTTQHTFANSTTTATDVSTEDPWVVYSSYYTGTIGDNLRITMYLQHYSDGCFVGWYYYNKYGEKNKLAIVGRTNSNNTVELFEINNEGVHTASFEGSFNRAGEFIGIMYVYHTQKRHTCKLYPTKF